MAAFEGLPDIASNVTRVLRSLIDSLDCPRVIEIGTSYGDHLALLSGSRFEMVSIDPMYDWVPDVRPHEEFDPTRVDARKVERWHANAAGLPVSLLEMRSWDAPPFLSGTFDVIVIDGCHHPADAVEQDYRSFSHLMADRHWVIFDDINHGDPRIAAERVRDDAQSSGSLASFEEDFGNRVWTLGILRKSSQV